MVKIVGIDEKRDAYTGERAVYVEVDGTSGGEMSTGRLLTDVRMYRPTEIVVFHGDPLAADIYDMVKQLRQNGYKVVIHIGEAKEMNPNYKHQVWRYYAFPELKGKTLVGDVEEAINVISVESKAGLTAARKAARKVLSDDKVCVAVAKAWKDWEVDVKKSGYMFAYTGE